MSHLTEARWHGYEGEPRSVEITVSSTLSSAQISAASLRIAGEPAVTLTPEAATGGYKLTADPVTLPDAGFYRWSVEVTDDDGNTPIVVAVGTVRVDERVQVAA
jgi:hypothetical protein